MKHSFSKIAKMPKETKVPANGAVTVDVKLEMPSESFDGVILGGLYFKEKKMKLLRINKRAYKLKINMHTQLVLFYEKQMLK